MVDSCYVMEVGNYLVEQWWLSGVVLEVCSFLEILLEVDSCHVMEDGNHLLGQWWWNGVWWVVDSLHEVDNFEVVGIHLMEQLLLHEMCVVVDTCFLFQ